MGLVALGLIAQDRDFLDVAGAVAGIAVAVLGLVAVVGAVVRWVTAHAIGDAVTTAVEPVRAEQAHLVEVTARLDARLTAHLDSEDAANEAWAKDWADFREQHTDDVRTLHARIDEALARAVHPSSWGLMPNED